MSHAFVIIEWRYHGSFLLTRDRIRVNEETSDFFVFQIKTPEAIRKPIFKTNDVTMNVL
jgi:hypothetical protein